MITIIDTTAPVWVTEAQSLDTTLSCSDVDGLDAAQLLTPEAMDNCGLDEQSIVKVAGDFVVGDCPQEGTYTNTWTIMDLCDNTSMMFTQVITIIDTTAPVWVTEAQSLDTTLSCSDVDGLDAAQMLVPEAMDLSLIHISEPTRPY